MDIMKTITGDRVQGATVEIVQELEEEADSSFDLFRDTDELADQYNYDYDDYIDELMWGDENWTVESHENAEDFAKHRFIHTLHSSDKLAGIIIIRSIHQSWGSGL